MVPPSWARRGARPAPTNASTGSGRLGETLPERTGHLRDKRAMGLQFLRAREVRARNSRLTDRNRRAADMDFSRVGIGNQAETDLPAAGQFYIDLREQLRIQQGAVLYAKAAIHAKACAKRVQTVLGAGVPCAGEHQSVDHPAHADDRPPAEQQLVIEEAEVERGVVRYERRIAKKLDQLLDLVREQGLTRQEDARQAVNGLRFRRHRTKRIEVSVEAAAGLDPVEHLDAA